MVDKTLSFRFWFPWRNNPRHAGKASVKASPSSQAQPPQETDDIPVSTSPASAESPKTQSPSHLSPSKKSQPAATASSQSQQVQEIAISQPPKPLRKIQVISENDPNADDSTPRETISITLDTSPKAIDIFFSSDNSDSDTLRGDHKQLSESETEPKAHRSPEKVVSQALTVEEKAKVPSPEKPLQEKVTQLHAAATDSANQTKDPLGSALQAEKHHKKQESFGRKGILDSTCSSDEKPIKNVSASESRISILQKMISSTGEQKAHHPNKDIRQEMLEKPADVITLAGENNGANMLLSSEPAKREESLPIRRNYKLSPDYSTKATTADGNVSNKEDISNDHMSTEDQQSKEVYVNSNVQSINNSVVFNTSVTERNPGVSILSTDSSNPDEYFNDKPEPLQTHKAENPPNSC